MFLVFLSILFAFCSRHALAAPLRSLQQTLQRWQDRVGFPTPLPPTLREPEPPTTIAVGFSLTATDPTATLSPALGPGWVPGTPRHDRPPVPCIFTGGLACPQGGHRFEEQHDGAKIPAALGPASASVSNITAATAMASPVKAKVSVPGPADQL
ncbi:hypothetical protein K488DRAFT_71056 [Vararia minispora EC-137]|uniref:Uncharacterized protein n=1 Tax=Vararia minispora EC-137 TaxID=1314806 RepID=A0ACB8QJD0_9AGAM|nr:hypothetical protein K488DRAFT_71056 [Vararia minispora EC-137]